MRYPAAFLLPLLAWLPLGAQTASPETPPDFFTHTVKVGVKEVTVDFVAHPIRHANFLVQVQKANGSFEDFAREDSRIYYGTVREHPGAVSAGWLKEDGTVFARIAFEDGEEWNSTGGDAVVSGRGKWRPSFPKVAVPSNGAGGTVYAAEVAIDLPYAQFTASGGTVSKAVQMAEWSVMSANYLYLRDAAILHQIGRVVVRSDQATDPYHLLPVVSTKTLIDECARQWQQGLVPAGSMHDIGLVAHPGNVQANGHGGLGGLGRLSSIGTPGYTSNGSKINGDFSAIWRHEAGHNWSARDGEDGGPEGPSIMAGNSMPRFSSSEVSRFIAHRNRQLRFLEALPSYPFPLPPRANLDSVVVEPGVATTLDVLANDSDSNGDALSLLSFDAASDRGGSVMRSFGTGPGGRDELRYTPPATFPNGTDFFRYRIVDSTGKTATGYVISRPSVTTAVKPLDRWKLDETTGTTALNSARGVHGTHLGGVQINQAPVSASTGKSASYDGVNGYTSLPLPGLSGRELSFSVWVRRNGIQAHNAAIFATRNGSSGETGLFFSGAGDMIMKWNGRNTPYFVTPQRPLPDNEWCLVVVTISPANAILRIRTPAAALYRLILAAPAGEFLEQVDFNGPLLLGRNQPVSGLPVYFRGNLDDFRIYPKTLSEADVEALHTQGRNPPTGEIIAPQPGALVNPTGTVLRVSGTSGSPLRAVEFIDPDLGLAYGQATRPPLELGVDFTAPGTRRLRAVADYGDWDYQIPLGPVAFTVLAEAKPAVSLAVEGHASRNLAVPADFVFRRPSAISSLSVPFALSGSAVNGVHYTELPTSISFAPGQTEVRLTLTPIIPAVDNLPLVAILTLDPLAPGAGYVVEGPTSMSMDLGKGTTSKASGYWGNGSTWSSELPAPAMGPQSVGDDYLILSDHTVKSDDTYGNESVTLDNQAFFARSLRIKSGGVLELVRNHTNQLRIVNYNLPPIRAEQGSSLNFKAPAAVRHILPGALHVTGDLTIRHTAEGAFDNDIRWAGPISGPGNISLSSSASPNSKPFRQLQVDSEDNLFRGNWTITAEPPTGLNSTGLSAAAPRALGTGMVTVGRRASLINQRPQGLDSLSGITLTGAASRLDLQEPVNGPSIPLTVNNPDATVLIGPARSTLGSLNGTAGTLKGNNDISRLTIQQQTDGVFNGALIAPLVFNKSGLAKLDLTGSIDDGVALGVLAGTLCLPASETVGALELRGGTLKLQAPTTGNIALTATKNVTAKGGHIEVALDALPADGSSLTVLRYHGVLTGAPNITVTGVNLDRLIVTTDLGSGLNDAVTLRFSAPY